MIPYRLRAFVGLLPLMGLIMTSACAEAASQINAATTGDAQSLAVGEVGTLAGPIEAGSGGLETDVDGNVYTADFGATLSSGPPGTRVWKITPEGEVSVFAEGLRGASGNTIAADGRFYQANIAGNTVSRIEANGEVVPFVTDGLNAPVGLVFDLDGNLMVANCGVGSISRVTPEGDVSLFVQDALLQCPNGLVRDDEGNLYVSNFMNGNVVRIAPDGSTSILATIPGGNNGHLVYQEGGFYVAARGNHQIVRLEMDGSFEVVAGSGGHGIDDGPALEATLSYPNDLALSPDGAVLYWNDVAAIVEDRGQTLAPTVVRMLRLR